MTTAAPEIRRTYCKTCYQNDCICAPSMKHPHQTPLQFAIANADTDAREETKLRQMVVYACETATVDVVQRLGRALNEALTLAFLTEPSVPSGAKPIGSTAAQRKTRTEGTGDK